MDAHYSIEVSARYVMGRTEQGHDAAFVCDNRSRGAINNKDGYNEHDYGAIKKI